MNIESLIMFCHVVEEGTISGAARIGYVSQPAVTKQIRQLENRYNALLFNRAGNKLSLTEAGATLYDYAKEIVQFYKRSQEAVDYINGKLETFLNVGASQTIGEYTLPELLGDFTKNHENIRFNLSIGNTPEILSKLRDNIIDIGLVEGILEEEKKLIDQDIIIDKLSTDELIVITSPSHRWRERKEVNVWELTEEKMIWREQISGTRRLIENALKDRGIIENINWFMELGSIQSIKSAVEADLGIAFIPKQTVKRELRFGLLREVKVSNFNLSRDLYMIQKNHRFRKIGLGKFIQFVKERK
ncbi:LysR family transcriptional regulator [Lederbergia panacisoli]|uniref:LysR family transcriptional regulator n=1 Tax=Lederbergia panacisoli TaxID=1255251 RepID=UPI00214AACC2|nr:LysR family transcriptional regulator [Lederbergia panacisoli]MCR2822988.1 LysR family transcriptional regulator [Lederbergia panacisoli]